MRRAMICVSVMLALLQFWPMVFGQRGGPTAAAATAPTEAPKPIPAVATAKPMPVQIAANTAPSSAPKGCYQQYRVAFGSCSKDDKACQIKMADKWDLCEATGFWPN